MCYSAVKTSTMNLVCMALDTAVLLLMLLLQATTSPSWAHLPPRWHNSAALAVTGPHSNPPAGAARQQVLPAVAPAAVVVTGYTWQSALPPCGCFWTSQPYSCLTLYRRLIIYTCGTTSAGYQTPGCELLLPLHLAPGQLSGTSTHPPPCRAHQTVGPTWCVTR
jgi:hypothetical protein